MGHVYSRYSILSFLAYFTTALVVLIFLFLAVDFLAKLWSSPASFFELLKYSTYNIPATLEKMIPVATMFAGVLFFTKLSKNNELVALYAMGKSSFNVIMPILSVVIILSILLFFISDTFVAKNLYKAKIYWNREVLKKNIVLNKTEQTTWYKQGSVILGIDKLFPESRLLEGIRIYKFKDNELKQVVFAKKAHFDEKNIYLNNVNILDLKTKNITKDTKYFIPFTLKQEILKSSDIVYLSNEKIREYAQYLENIKLPAFKYWTEYYKRYSIAFSVIVMFLISILFSLNPNRRNHSASKSISTGILVIFIYWFLLSTTLSLGTRGIINPFIAAWLSNILFFSISLFCIYKRQ